MVKKSERGRSFSVSGFVIVLSVVIVLVGMLTGNVYLFNADLAPRESVQDLQDESVGLLEKLLSNPERFRERQASELGGLLDSGKVNWNEAVEEATENSEGGVAGVSCEGADVNGDGFVDGQDLVLVILAWGNSGGIEDVNSDGIVNGADLVEVILNWGVCQQQDSPRIHSSGLVGVHNVGAVLVNTDSGTVPCSIEEVEDSLLGTGLGDSVNELLMEQSDGQFSITVEVFGPVSVTGTSNTYEMMNAVDEILEGQGVQPASYHQMIYYTAFDSVPDPTVGGGSVIGGRRVHVIGCLNKQTTIHEVGHSYGFKHSLFPYDYFEDGNLLYIGDPSGDMAQGIDSPPVSFNALRREQLGWLENSEYVFNSGVYEIDALELSGNSVGNPQALKIYKADSNEYYYLSFRTPIGFSSNILEPYLGTYFLDKLQVQSQGMSNPNTEGQSFSIREGSTVMHDTLDVGEIYVDSVNGISFEVLDKSASTITVDISLGVEGAPAIDTERPDARIYSHTTNMEIPENTNVHLTAFARDNVGIQHVDFIRGASLDCEQVEPFGCDSEEGTLLCRDEEAPYECDWVIPPGFFHSVRAVAEDTSGQKSYVVTGGTVVLWPV